MVFFPQLFSTVKVSEMCSVCWFSNRFMYVTTRDNTAFKLDLCLFLFFELENYLEMKY